MKYIMMAIILMAVLIFAGCSQTPTGNIIQETKEPIKIGFIAPLTGDVSSIGQSTKKSVELAVAEINSMGGVDGRELKVIYEDGKCSGKDANNAANKLINIDEVDYIIGGICSAETMSFAVVAEESKTLVISPCSSNADITNMGDYIFRAYPSDLFQGKFAAEYAYNELDARRVAILASQSDWGAGLKKVFRDTFVALGGEIVLIEEFPQGSADLRTSFIKVKELNPDLIYMPAYTESSVNGLKQAEELGITTQLFGGDAWSDRTIWERTKGYADGNLYVEVDVEIPEAFETKFRNAYGSDAEVTLCAPQAYDVVRILTGVISQVGTNPTNVKNALYKIQPYSGVSGKISFDSNGDLNEAGYVVMEITNGKPVARR
jgi:branched-chain amino acid transport system substrate-binding protein